MRLHMEAPKFISATFAKTKTFLPLYLWACHAPVSLNKETLFRIAVQLRHLDAMQSFVWFKCFIMFYLHIHLIIINLLTGRIITNWCNFVEICFWNWCEEIIEMFQVFDVSIIFKDFDQMWRFTLSVLPCKWFCVCICFEALFKINIMDSGTFSIHRLLRFCGLGKQSRCSKNVLLLFIVPVGFFEILPDPPKSVSSVQ